MKKLNALYALALWLAGAGAALAQVNSIEAFNVSQQDTKTIVRVTTKEALKSVPPNFAITSPARIAFDFPKHSERARARQPGYRAGRAAQHEPRARCGSHQDGPKSQPSGAA